MVHRARDVLTGMQYAVKSLNKFTSDGFPLDARQKQFQRTEMQLHYEVSAHPNIVSLLRILDLQDCTLVVMDYCPEGDLFQNITEQGRYVGNDEEAKAIFLQILDAVAHCHGLGVYHRDLKPENILVSDEGRQVKLADFGLATRDERSSDFGCGSTFYMSPGRLYSSCPAVPCAETNQTVCVECQNQASGSSYACAPNDIWSLGVILVNLTCGRNPWKAATTKDSTFRAYMEDRQFLKSILPLSDQLNEILGMIFELDPTKRISLEELRQRIIECPAFTKKVVDEDLEVFSRSSSVSDGSSSEDSDMSVFDEEATPGFSRSSTVSEGSTASDCSEDSDMSDDVDVQIMDEETNTNDHQPAIKEEPKLLSSSYCTIEPSHVAEAPSPVDTTGMENLHIIQSVEPTPAPKVSSWQRNSFLNFAAARRQFHRSVTPAQATLLSSFCGQRKSPLQRVF